MRPENLLPILCVLALAWLVGCNEPDANELAVKKVRHVLVVPAEAPACNPAAASAAAGLAVTTLQQDLPEGMTVREADPLWRLKPTPAGLTTNEALALARKTNADGVLSCSAKSVALSTGNDTRPEAMRTGEIARFSQGPCRVTIRLQLLQVSDGAVIYNMASTSEDHESAEQVRSGVDKTLSPLLKLWKSRD